MKNDCVLLGDDERRIFIAGDFATQEGTVAAAIGSGRAAAERICSALLGTRHQERKREEIASGDFVSVRHFPRSPQHHPRTLSLAERRTTFSEVCLGYADEAEGLVSAGGSPVPQLRALHQV